MRFLKCGSSMLLGLLILACERLEGVENQTVVMAEFVGSSPCDELPKAFLNIPSESQCERITWELTLFTNRDNTLPAVFTLVTTYGMQAQSSSGFVGGGKKITLEGKWAKVKGTRDDPDALVYELKSNQGHDSISFVSVSEDILHLLNREKRLMVGNASWSYTLNRKARDK